MNTKLRIAIGASAVLLGVLASGCAQRIGAFTIASTKNVQVSSLTMGERVEGKHSVWFGVPSIEQAIDDAIEKSPGADALSDVVIWISNGFFKRGFKVVGTPINTKKTGSLEGIDGPLLTAENASEALTIAKVIRVDTID